ncbi:MULTISPECIES: site-2 protease family protein [Acidithrix]|uniref:Peptidase family M50 n=1 Tax=Acidithrix ferrooxidans TaxID=1280514 RepID=A0A0D8HCW3_9ACTN|nr:MULTISPECIES: site-2 protease family protein [Acidithrix]KJF15815.1 peptidase family M50 [Acidithrix ferrooxidans]CAG4905769.1 unnamed protein product [Acidithrix sp. C25]
MNRKVLIYAGIALVAFIALSKGILNVYLGINFLAAIIALVLHEISHGLVALYYGDHTAAKAGRLRLNPLAHIDPFGTLILPGMLMLLGLTPIGYAKPVPVNAANLRNPRRSSLVVSLAGPVTNLILSILAGIILRIFVFSNSYGSTTPILGGSINTTSLIGYFWVYFGIINAIYFIFNILPIPPLDGSAILRRVIGEYKFAAITANLKFLIPILLLVVFIFPGALSSIFAPIVRLWLDVFLPSTAYL